MKEIYKDIKGYEGLYQVSNLGNVRSLRNNKILIKKTDRYGYSVVNLANKIVKTKKVHRLVAEAFIPNPNNLKTVNHIDKNRKNNNVNNLEWLSIKDNVNYSCSKKVLKYDLDGNFMEKYDSVKEACEKNNVFRGNIRRCCNDFKKTTGGYKWRYEIEEDL